MQPRFEWIRGKPLRGSFCFAGTESWWTHNGDLRLHVWRCPTGWWMHAMIVADRWGDSGWGVLYEDSLLGHVADCVQAMLRCELRTREVVVGHFGKLLIPSNAADRGAENET
jgi:hypothetical protein